MHWSILRLSMQFGTQLMIYQRPRGTAERKSKLCRKFFFFFTKEALSQEEDSVILADTETCDPRAPICLVEASVSRHLQGKASRGRWCYSFDACRCVFEEWSIRNDAPPKKCLHKRTNVKMAAARYRPRPQLIHNYLFRESRRRDSSIAYRYWFLACNNSSRRSIRDANKLPRYWSLLMHKGKILN